MCDSLKTMDFKPLDESEFDMGKTMKRHGSVVVITDEEYETLVDYAIEIGIENGFIQEGDTAEESFIPAFDCEGV